MTKRGTIMDYDTFDRDPVEIKSPEKEYCNLCQIYVENLSSHLKQVHPESFPLR